MFLNQKLRIDLKEGLKLIEEHWYRVRKIDTIPAKGKEIYGWALEINKRAQTIN